MECLLTYLEKVAPLNAVNVKEDKFVDYPSHKASDIIQIQVLLRLSFIRSIISEGYVS